MNKKRKVNWLIYYLFMPVYVGVRALHLWTMRLRTVVIKARLKNLKTIIDQEKFENDELDNSK